LRAALSAVVIVMTMASSATASFAPRKPCGTISGPNWTFLKGPETGTKYAVVAIGGFACPSVKQWVAKLVTDPVKTHASSLVIWRSDSPPFSRLRD